MTEGEESYERVVAQLAQMPDVIAQLCATTKPKPTARADAGHAPREGPASGSSRTHALSRASRVRHWRSARTASVSRGRRPGAHDGAITPTR
jgi:hypothetical protein